jgi:hydrogen peroxide-dependent heme synthase
MTEPVTPSTGLVVVHLFCSRTPFTENEEVVAAVKSAEAAGVQVVSVAVFGHKAELAFMLLGPDMWALRDAQTALTRAGLAVVDSYVSLTELSEYAQGLPDAMKEARLFPQLPPEGKPAWCFYPMSKKREAHVNWFTLAFEDRRELMHEHGASGRKFAGRILQLITGSTGLDDYEWGVTLFAVRPDDLKDVVYTMRFDRASADYAEFGPFYTGLVTTVEDLVART